MGEVTQGQFFEAMRQLHDKIDQKHSNMHRTLDDRFDQLDRKLEQHEKDDRLVENRVLTIETNINSDERLAVRRGTLYGVIAATGTTGILNALQHFLFGK